MVKQEYKYSEITGKVIGCAMRVHSALGNGFTHWVDLFFKGIRECFAFQEVIYQRALAIEMADEGSRSMQHKRIVNRKINQRHQGNPAINKISGSDS